MADVTTTLFGPNNRPLRRGDAIMFGYNGHSIPALVRQVSATGLREACALECTWEKVIEIEGGNNDIDFDANATTVDDLAMGKWMFPPGPIAGASSGSNAAQVDMTDTEIDIVSFSLVLSQAARVHAFAAFSWTSSLSGTFSPLLKMDGTTKQSVSVPVLVTSSGALMLMGEAALAAGTRVVLLRGSVTAGTVTVAAGAATVFCNVVPL